MSLRGLISGVVGGAAKGYTEYAKQRLDVDLKKELMAAEEEKLRRLEEFKANLGVQTKKREIEELDPLKTESEANRTTVVGAAETGVLANREDTLRGPKAATARATAIAQGDAERDNLKALGNDPAALGGLRKKTDASESSATRAQAAASNFKLSQDRATADLRKKLSKTDDPEERAKIEQSLKDLTGTLSTKSYGDMVTAAGHYRMLAQNLRKDAESLLLEDDERAALKERALYYEREADAILQSTKNQRLPNASKPAATAAPAQPAAKSKPWEMNWGTPGNSIGNVVAP